MQLNAYILYLSPEYNILYKINENFSKKSKTATQIKNNIPYVTDFCPSPITGIETKLLKRVQIHHLFYNLLLLINK